MVKLKSGREVKYRPLNALEAAEVEDINQAYYLENPVTLGKTLSMKAIVRSIIIGCGLNVEDLQEWSREEKIECAMMIWKDSFLLEADKKK